MREQVRQTLKRNLFVLSESPQDRAQPSGPELVMQLRIGAVQDGIRRGQWSISLKRADGSESATATTALARQTR